jgi:hypothetical protein
MHSDHTWKRDGWWRVEAPDGSIWCETSDEEEAREFMREGDTLLVHLKCTEEKWSAAE